MTAAKKRFLFLSNMAAPYQVKLCYAMQEYFDAEFWFYVQLEPNRPKFWAVPLGDKCKILDHSFYVKGFNHNNFHLLPLIKKFAPDVILMGGFFFPTHYLIKRWAKKNNVKVVVSAEMTAYSSNKAAAMLKLWIKKVQHSLFKDIDLLFAMGDKPCEQFTGSFGFPANKVVITQYPQDIDENLKHPVRVLRKDAMLILPNRLDPMYNPLFVLDVFLALKRNYPEIRLMMNATGLLKDKCREFISMNDLSGDVSFIEGLKNWDDLPQVYAKADIALFAATDSNGPNTLIESMASGCGIVMSDMIFNTGEYARNGDNCFVCPLEKEAFITSIRKYLDDPALLPLHGARSKLAVSNRSVKETAKLYAGIINDRFFAVSLEKKQN